MQKVHSASLGLIAALAAPTASFAMSGFGAIPFEGAALPAASVQLPGQSPAVTLGFNIILNYVNTPNPGEAAAFAAAEAQWESYITGYKADDIANTNVTINVNLAPNDGPGGILGSAGPQTAKLNAAQTMVNSQFVYTQTGAMNFDTADTPGLVAAGSFSGVVLHEMGHVLGIGTLWDSSAVGFSGRQELYNANSGQYTGAFGLAAYNAEFGQTGTFVPVELAGGAGTANAHWDEVTGGAGATGRVSILSGQDMRNELMTGWLNTPLFTSQLTIQGMQDLGYVTVVPEPATAALVVAAGALVARRRRRA